LALTVRPGAALASSSFFFSLALKPGPDSEARFRIPAAPARGLPLSIADPASAGASTDPREIGCMGPFVSLSLQMGRAVGAAVGGFTASDLGLDFGLCMGPIASFILDF